MQRITESAPSTSVLNGLWLLLVKQDKEASIKIEDQVPVMAKAGNDQNYLLGFKNAANARKFLADSEIDNAEPRMVVAANSNNFLTCARVNGAAGLLVDFDPNSGEYFKACELY
ncbi:MAG: hypothetical protein JKY56_03940 [Kofleriaceae bacterium]|nr:hypothetical protein [Kofleriaceae bacterium]